jgi:hypothetical protein
MRKRINLTISEEAYIKYQHLKDKLCINISDLISKTLENIMILEKPDKIYVVTTSTIIRVDDECLKREKKKKEN